jgi:hypothetical protein
MRAMDLYQGPMINMALACFSSRVVRSPNQGIQWSARTMRPTDARRSHQIENGDLMDPDKIMDGLSKELNVALKAMAKSKNLNEKEAYSRIIKNLCESLGVFLKLASEMMQFDDDNDDLKEEDIPF